MKLNAITVQIQMTSYSVPTLSVWRHTLGAWFIAVGMKILRAKTMEEEQNFPSMTDVAEDISKIYPNNFEAICGARRAYNFIKTEITKQ